MSQDTQPGDLGRVTRVIDVKLPLTWLLGVAFAAFAAFASIYFRVGQLGEDMTDLKIAVKAGNGSQASIQGEMAILKFRIETLESDKKAAK
jgi:hypothetical protein